jgi:hypothetical protein
MQTSSSALSCNSALVAFWSARQALIGAASNWLDPAQPR